MIKLGDIYYSGLHVILLYYSVSEIIMAVEIVAEPDTNYSMTLNFRPNYSENCKHHSWLAAFLSGLRLYRPGCWMDTVVVLLKYKGKPTLPPAQGALQGLTHSTQAG